MKIIIPLAKPYIDSQDIDGVNKVLRSGILSLGPNGPLFEREFSSYIGTKYACTVANGTCGLHLAVKALNLPIQSEVITSPFSFIASANCLLYERLKPVFIDIDPVTFNLDATKIEAAITKKTRAILPVHIFGQAADMTPIIRIAKRYSLRIIEDACESLGATYNERKTGTFSDAAVFAFYPNKQMTTGEGGMIVTNNRKIYELVTSFRNQGRKASDQWLIHHFIGYNYRMSELHAALGISQLKKINWMIDQKNKIVHWYNELLVENEYVKIPEVGPNRIPSWFVYVIRVLKNRRNLLMEKLANQGIQSRAYLPVIHLQPIYKKLFNYTKNTFPVAERTAEETIALPFFIGLRKNNIEYIAHHIHKALYD